MSAEASVGRMQDLRAELPLRLSLCLSVFVLFCLFCLFIIMKFECFPEIKGIRMDKFIDFVPLEAWD
jgi:hypothetical protein